MILEGGVLNDPNANTLYGCDRFFFFSFLFWGGSNSIQGQKLDLQNFSHTQGKYTGMCSFAVSGKQQGNETCTKKKEPSI